MFGKTTLAPAATTDTTMPEVQVIPRDFYGGANPVVTFKDVKTELPPPGTVLSAGEKKHLDKTTMVGSEMLLHPARLFTNPRWLAMAAVVLLVVVSGASGLYYWLRRSSPPSPVPAAIVPPTTAPVVAEAPTTSVPETTAETAPPVAPAPTPTAGAEISFPSLFLGDGTDIDGDGLSDAEEELFRTDPAIPDSDGDKFTDANEVYNLYDPAAAGRTKLVDSGAVKPFTNSVFGYTLDYPSGWALGNVDDTYRTILFSTLSAEYVEVHSFDKASDLSFNDWFAAHAADQQLGQLTSFETAFKDQGLRRQDYLVYYFVTAEHVYVMVYHPVAGSPVNYRSVIKMMARSFHVTGTAAAPVLAPRPVEGATSTPAEAALPVSTTTPSATTTGVTASSRPAL